MSQSSPVKSQLWSRLPHSVVIQPGVPLDAVTLSKPHPRIIRQLDSDGTSSYTMVCDSQLCECGQTFTEAFDYFFKLFFVFNLEYPPGHINFFKFIEAKIFGLQCGLRRVPPTVNEVARLLKLDVWFFLQNFFSVDLNFSFVGLFTIFSVMLIV